MASTLRLFLLLFLFSMAFVFISFKSPYAASNGIQTLVDKLDRLEKDLNGLQKYVFKGEKNKKDNLDRIELQETKDFYINNVFSQFGSLDFNRLTNLENLLKILTV